MIFLLAVVLIFGVDFFVKKYVEKTKRPGVGEPKLGGRIVIRRTSNYGTAGSKLKDKPKLVCAFHSISMLFLAAGYIRLLAENRKHGLKLAGALLLGGGASNLYDRMKKGYVTDYVSFNVPFRAVRNLVFNISDFFIFAGGILGVIFALKDIK